MYSPDAIWEGWPWLHAATSLPLPAQKPASKKTIDSTIPHGVQLGAQTYSFRDRPLDGMIQAMVEVGLGDCEVYSPHIEPKMTGPDAKINRETLREWRIHAPMDVMRQARKKFDDAGIDVSAYNLSFRDDFTDEEIDHGFQLSKAFGVNMITASSTVSTAPAPGQRRREISDAGGLSRACRRQGFQPIRQTRKLRKGAGPLEAVPHQSGHRALRGRGL